MLNTFWPLALVVAANVLYNIASKSLPLNCSPFIALVVTYLTAGFLSLMAFFIFEENKNILAALQNVNWTGYALGISMVGLEIGYIFLYRHGWKISVASLLANILLAVALLIIGLFFYRERLNFQQFLGIGMCLAGCVTLLLAADK